jgi:hypothetical protein
MGKCGVDSTRGRGPCRARGRTHVLRGLLTEVVCVFSTPMISSGEEGKMRRGWPSASQSNVRERLRQTVGSRFAARTTEVVNQATNMMSRRGKQSMRERPWLSCETDIHKIVMVQFPTRMALMAVEQDESASKKS